MVWRAENMHCGPLAPPFGLKHAHFGARLLEAYAWFKPPNQMEEVASTISWIGRVELKSSPNISRIVGARRKGVIRRHHPDDRGWLLVDLDLFADDVRSSGECALPERIRDHRGARSADAV